MAPRHTRIATLAGLPPRVDGNARTAARLRTQSPPGGHVRWLPGQIPGSEEEKILYEGLTQQGLQSFRDVKTYLADTLYWRDFLRGGWATDIALLRPLYAREAHEIISRLEGVRLLIEDAE